MRWCGVAPPPPTIFERLNRKNYLILIMTPEKQDKTLEFSKHWSADSTPARNEVIMKTGDISSKISKVRQNL